jgi:hypothetical protein
MGFGSGRFLLLRRVYSAQHEVQIIQAPAVLMSNNGTIACRVACPVPTVPLSERYPILFNFQSVNVENRAIRPKPTMMRRAIKSVVAIRFDDGTNQSAGQRQTIDVICDQFWRTSNIAFPFFDED